MYSLESYSKHQRKSGKTSFITGLMLLLLLFVLTVLGTQEKIPYLSKNPLVYIALSTIILLFVGTGTIFFERAISSENIKKNPIVHWVYNREDDVWIVDDHTETIISENGIYYSPAKDKMLNFWSFSSKLESLTVGELPGYEYSALIFYFVKARTFQGNTISTRLYVPIPKGQEEYSERLVIQINQKVRAKKMRSAKMLTLLTLIVTLIILALVYIYR